jgi:glycosidase
MVAVASCSDVPDEPSGECAVSIWNRTPRDPDALAIRGAWDDWSSEIAMRRFDDAWYVAELSLPPGEYGYVVVDRGTQRLDRHNGLGGFRDSDGAEVSWLVVDACDVPRVAGPEEAVDDELALALVPAADGAPILEVDVSIDGGEVIALGPGLDGVRATAPLGSLDRGRHVLALQARDAASRAGPVQRHVVWREPRAETHADAIVYQIMIDRYRGDEGQALSPPPHPGARAGGTLGGVLAELERGTFDELGVSTLWLSPVYTNPHGERGGRPGDPHVYESYHGYWPADTRAVDPRIGSEVVLDALVDAAHARGIRVVLDLVPNHYDQTHPRVAAHRADRWFNERDPECICGTPDCPWSTEIERCWFTSYLPDVRMQQPDALAAAIDDAVWWHERFGVDGFRVDAVPMMPRAATRRIYERVRRTTTPRRELLLLGEVFTGPGAEGVADLRYHLGPDGLDSTFDFPTMWAIRDALTGRAGFDVLADLLAHEDAELAGSGAVLARMLGNHDTTRIASAVAGDDARDPWDDPPPDTVDDDVLAAIRVGFVLVFGLPGIPVVYYGDEIGLPGAADPDSRRVLPADDAVGDAAAQLAQDVGRLGRLRACMPTLRRGTWRSLGATSDHFGFVRELDGEASVLVVVSAARQATTLVIPAAASPGWYKDALSGTRVEVDATGASIDLPPLGAVVLIPEEHDCGA